jgi:peptidoglycan/xylan/chitin deacetylase (PgdA/CDA1 family)
MKVALTFDDGPSRWTPRILDVLARAGARATFFVVGRHVSGYEDALRRAVAEGHELGNHGDTHTRPSLLRDDELAAELERTNERVRAATGVAPRLVRPPYGDDADRVAAIASRLGFAATVRWSVDPRDWEQPAPEEIARRVLAAATPGAIVLLHDGFQPATPRSGCSGTVEALERILPGLREQAYELVTVSELLASP